MSVLDTSLSNLLSMPLNEKRAVLYGRSLWNFAEWSRGRQPRYLSAMRFDVSRAGSAYACPKVWLARYCSRRFGRAAFILPFYSLRLWGLSIEDGVGMAKPFVVCTLCIISAAVGAAVDHYLAGAVEHSGRQLERAASLKAAVAAPAEMSVEVLGDKVKCDVRYEELKIPVTEYRSFKRKCMGDKWDGD